VDTPALIHLTTQLTHFKTMTEQNTQYQIIDLSDEQLAGVAGGHNEEQTLWQKRCGENVKGRDPEACFFVK